MSKPETENEDEELKEFLLMQYRTLLPIIRWIERKYNIVDYQQRVTEQMLKVRLGKER